MSAPIQRTKLYEDVADRILERVRAGTWPAGSRLPAEGELAEEFDVSRSTVRAAVRSLRIAGVLQPRNGSGTYVTAQAQMILDTRELAAVMGDPARIRDLVETRLIGGQPCLVIRTEGGVEVNGVSIHLDEPESKS